MTMQRWKVMFRFRREDAWASNGTYFFGTESDARHEEAALERSYGCAFELVKSPEFVAEPDEHFCGGADGNGCGGDLRDPAGSQYACKCPRAEQVDRHDGIRWVRETVVFTPGKEAAS